MKNAVRAAFILSAFTFAERTIGFLFKIFLSRELGASAVGVYQVALSFFLVLLTLITSGIPLVVSKMTAKYRAEGLRKLESSITTSALLLGLAVASVCSVVILALKNQIGALFATPKSITLVVLMLPSLFFSAVYSAYRGNLWGQQKYTLASALELGEQICRIICFVLFILIGFDKLKATAVSTCVSCFVSATACVLCYVIYGGKFSSPKSTFATLTKSAFPVTVARVSTGVVSSIVAIIVPMLLISGGMDAKNAMYVYGYSVGMAMPLVFVPLTFVGSISFVLIPSLSTASAMSNDKSVIRQIEKALEVSIVLGVMLFPAFFVLGEPIGVFLYGNADAGKFLSASAWLILPIALENITSSMMNTLDLEYKGLLNYFIGSAVMFGILFAFKTNFNIYYYTVGMGASLIISSVLDVLAMRKKIKFGAKILPNIVKNCALLFPACLMTRWSYDLTAGLHEFFRIAIGAGSGFLFLMGLFFLFGSIKTEYFFKKNSAQVQKNIAIRKHM